MGRGRWQGPVVRLPHSIFFCVVFLCSVTIYSKETSGVKKTMKNSITWFLFSPCEIILASLQTAPNNSCFLVFMSLCCPITNQVGPTWVSNRMLQKWEWILTLDHKRNSCSCLAISWIICSGGSQLPYHEAIWIVFWGGPCGKELKPCVNSQHWLSEPP